MTSKTNIEQLVKQRWYTQGTNGVPVFIVTSGYSAFYMKRILGYGYSKFFFHFKKRYTEMNYVQSDFLKVWNHIEVHVARDSQYLKKVKKKYDAIFKKDKKFLDRINPESLRSISDDQLLQFLKKSTSAQTESVGIAHVIESVGQILEQRFRVRLHAEVRDKQEYAATFSHLTTPKQPSFVSKEEKELLAISKLPKKRQEAALQNHIKKYSWIQNTYAGSVPLGLAFFKRKLKGLIKEEKQKKSAFYSADVHARPVSQHIKEMAEVIRFTTAWQDERKANILIAIEKLDIVMKEVSRRIRIPVSTLYYLAYEVFSAKQIRDFIPLRKELKQRQKGCFILTESHKATVFAGRLCAELEKKMREQTAKKSNVVQVNGMIANGGAAIGRVVVCKDVSQIHRVQEGDILVTSMTRPEFMPALKKAAAIVTDEGGITSHAAIVARELGIPAVIGTKVATKVLKTGMQVEVRANHGLIKIM